MFAEVEGIIKRQINVSKTPGFLYSIHSLLVIHSLLFSFMLVRLMLVRLLFYPIYIKVILCPAAPSQMSVLPSVQPFHAIAYPIDPLLALEIRYSNFPLVYAFENECRPLNFSLGYYSRSYASHCLKIASRFSLPSFNHPPPVPIKRNGGHERLRLGYVFI